MAVEMKSGDALEASSEVKNNADSKETVVIDIKDDQDSTVNSNSSSTSNSEKVCRICLESSPHDVIALGCDCRGELGFSHPKCATTWFSMRRNTECEICGKTAKNVHRNRLVRERSHVVEVEVEIEVEDREWDGCGYIVSILLYFGIMSILLYYIFH